jgi:hypothetical protein
MNNQQWKCKRCCEMVDMVNFRCGCAVSPSPWEPVAYGDITNTFGKIHPWEVYILPNNQPIIELGEYYAVNSKIAMEMAAVNNQISIDENWGARLKEK